MLQEKYLHVFLSHTNQSPQPEWHWTFYHILWRIACEVPSLDNEEFWEQFSIADQCYLACHAYNLNIQWHYNCHYS